MIATRSPLLPDAAAAAAAPSLSSSAASAAAASPGGRKPLASRAWGFLKSYAAAVTGAYLELLPAGALLFVFMFAFESHGRDTERVGLTWLHYAQMSDNSKREAQFPAHPPESREQKRRDKAAAEDATAVAAAASM